MCKDTDTKAVTQQGRTTANQQDSQQKKQLITIKQGHETARNKEGQHQHTAKHQGRQQGSNTQIGRQDKAVTQQATPRQPKRK